MNYIGWGQSNCKAKTKEKTLWYSLWLELDTILIL